MRFPPLFKVIGEMLFLPLLAVALFLCYTAVLVIYVLSLGYIDGFERLR